MKNVLLLASLSLATTPAVYSMDSNLHQYQNNNADTVVQPLPKTIEAVNTADITTIDMNQCAPYYVTTQQTSNVFYDQIVNFNYTLGQSSAKNNVLYKVSATDPDKWIGTYCDQFLEISLRYNAQTAKTKIHECKPALLTSLEKLKKKLEEKKSVHRITIVNNIYTHIEKTKYLTWDDINNFNHEIMGIKNFTLRPPVFNSIIGKNESSNNLIDSTLLSTWNSNPLIHVPFYLKSLTNEKWPLALKNPILEDIYYNCYLTSKDSHNEHFLHVSSLIDQPLPPLESVNITQKTDAQNISKIDSIRFDPITDYTFKSWPVPCIMNKKLKATYIKSSLSEKKDILTHAIQTIDDYLKIYSEAKTTFGHYESYINQVIAQLNIKRNHFTQKQLILNLFYTIKNQKLEYKETRELRTKSSLITDISTRIDLVTNIINNYQILINASNLDKEVLGQYQKKWTRVRDKENTNLYLLNMLKAKTQEIFENNYTLYKENKKDINTHDWDDLITHLATLNNVSKSRNFFSYSTDYTTTINNGTYVAQYKKDKDYIKQLLTYIDKHTIVPPFISQVIATIPYTSERWKELKKDTSDPLNWHDFATLSKYNSRMNDIDWITTGCVVEKKVQKLSHTFANTIATSINDIKSIEEKINSIEAQLKEGIQKLVDADKGLLPDYIKTTAELKTNLKNYVSESFTVTLKALIGNTNSLDESAIAWENYNPIIQKNNLDDPRTGLKNLNDYMGYCGINSLSNLTDKEVLTPKEIELFKLKDFSEHFKDMDAGQLKEYEKVIALNDSLGKLWEQKNKATGASTDTTQNTTNKSILSEAQTQLNLWTDFLNSPQSKEQQKTLLKDCNTLINQGNVSLEKLNFAVKNKDLSFLESLPLNELQQDYGHIIAINTSLNKFVEQNKSKSPANTTQNSSLNGAGKIEIWKGFTNLPIHDQLAHVADYLNKNITVPEEIVEKLRSYTFEDINQDNQITSEVYLSLADYNPLFETIGNMALNIECLKDDLGDTKKKLSNINNFLEKNKLPQSLNSSFLSLNIPDRLKKLDIKNLSEKCNNFPYFKDVLYEKFLENSINIVKSFNENKIVNYPKICQAQNTLQMHFHLYKTQLDQQAANTIKTTLEQLKEIREEKKNAYLKSLAAHYKPLEPTRTWRIPFLSSIWDCLISFKNIFWR